MKKLLKFMAFVAIFALITYVGSAWAEDDAGGLGSIVSNLKIVFDDVRKVFYVLAAFGLIGMAAAALLGKIQWKWLWALVFGVAVVACADYIVSYAADTGAGVEEGDSGNYGGY
jgi:hypothetical protein